MKIILLLLSYSLLLMAGCQQVQEQLHPWQRPGNSWAITIPVNEWDVIPSKHLGRVSPEHIPDAKNKLKSLEFVEITPAYAVEVCKKADFREITNLKPYLVRGVSFNNCPTYSIVKRNKENWIYVFQATYNGEIYIPGMKYISEESPIVIYLDKAPEKIFPVANVGGDGIFRGINFESTWKE